MESIWTKSCEIKKREQLREDTKTEIAVIGAGMAGVLIAYKLMKSGKKVIVLEARRIAKGQTCNTTAKITSQHDLIYHKLTENMGVETTKMYAMANENAINEYERIINEEKISCDFEKKTSYIYSENAGLLKTEAKIAQQLGLPASYTERVSIPIKEVSAVRFSNQAQFNPLKFIKAISENLEIYEKTPVITVEDNTLVTPKAKVTADKIIFACHYPFLNFPGLYFARMHQERSYVIALENAMILDGMYKGADEMNAYSFRNYGDILLFGGAKHRTGENSEGGRYDSLRKKAKELFPNSKEVACWSAQDCITSDSVPYIGQYCADKPDWYIATGFQKWGMTSSMVSAMILNDLICGNQNPYAQVFSPSRFAFEDIPGIACESGHAVKGLSKRIFGNAEISVDRLPKGQGGVVLINGSKAGAYRDEKGKLYIVDIKCPHLGCQLEWNSDEKSWDCPCHGSRFDYKGNLISNPAQTNIKISQQEELKLK